MTKPVVHCAVYTRKSSEEGLDQAFNSLEAQREAGVAYIQSQKHEGWIEIKESYDDGGFSGGNMERTALVRLLNEVRAGKIGIIVVYKVDRLTRSLSDFAQIIDVLDSHQVSFVSVTQQFSTTTSMGRLTLNVLLSFAQFERELTGERIRDKVAASKKKGMWMGGLVPLGYDCVERKLIINDSESETVRAIFRQYVRLGSVMAVKEYLEKKEIRSKIRTTKDGRTYGGAIYSRGALYQILNSRMYIGKIVHRGEIYAAQHEPIIEQKLWDQVAAFLKANNRAKRTSRICATSSLLTGLLRDANGIRLTPTHAVKKGKRYRYYTSQAVIQKHGDRPRIARYPAMEIETVVTAQIHRMLKSFDTYLTGNKKTPQGELAVQRAKDLSVRWPGLPTTEQREFIRAVVKTVRLGQKNLWIDVDKLKLMEMLTGKSADKFREPSNRKPDVINLTADFQPVRHGAELKVHTPDDRSSTSGPVPSLVKTVARARMWYEQLISGEASSVEDLALRAGFKCRYARKILQCAVLSPDISEAILSGRQARHLTVKNLQSGLPLDWQQQRRDLLVTS